MIPKDIEALEVLSAVGDVFEVKGMDELVALGPLGIGSGGFVEKHRHVATGTILALKVCQAGDIEDSKKKAIVLELRTFQKCKNPHIVNYYGAFYHPSNGIAIALEYMDAGALCNILRKRFSIPESIMSSITWQVLDGLEYLHVVMRVIHRDIKPSNLLINTAGITKITDFGVSGELEDDLKSVGGKETFVGTMYYMSPERIETLPHSFNSDTWSFGLTLVECITGCHPYVGSEVPKKLSFWEVLNLIKVEDPPRLPDQGYSAELRDFVERSLQKEPKGRPEAAELKLHPWPGDSWNEERRATLAAWIVETCAAQSVGSSPVRAAELQPLTSASSAASARAISELNMLHQGISFAPFGGGVEAGLSSAGSSVHTGSPGGLGHSIRGVGNIFARLPSQDGDLDPASPALSSAGPSRSRGGPADVGSRSPDMESHQQMASSPLRSMNESLRGANPFRSPTQSTGGYTFDRPPEQGSMEWSPANVFRESRPDALQEGIDLRSPVTSMSESIRGSSNPFKSPAASSLPPRSSSGLSQ